MASFHHLDDIRSLTTKIDSKAHDLFKQMPGHAPLQVRRISPQSPDLRTRNVDIWDIPQLQDLASRSEDSTQIYTIRQDRSWTTLNISCDMFEGFMDANQVMPPFWKCMFTFGRKSQENEFEFPGFRKRTSARTPASSTLECAYMLRRVELNGRDGAGGEPPWSIRQSAVYHKLATPNCNVCIGSNVQIGPNVQIGTAEPKSTFLLVAPSENAEQQIASNCSHNGTLSPWNMHRILVADSLRGWMDYMTHLEHRLKDRSDRIVLATVGTDKESLSLSTDFKINFEDRQELKIVEDQILDLQIILPSMLEAIVRIREELHILSRGAGQIPDEDREEVEHILEEFEEYEREVKVHIERAKTLKQQSLSTSQLLSDVLSYEEAVALKTLARETQIESLSMRHLTEKSTKDAAAVKILTVITLIYLPTTIVANFFSTQFVHTSNETGAMSVAPNAWLLAAIAVPLTVLTIGLWYGWVYFTRDSPIVDRLHPGVVTLQKQNSFKTIVSSRKKRTGREGDLEMGIQTPTSSFYFSSTKKGSMEKTSPASTWKSGEGTMAVKEG